MYLVQQVSLWTANTSWVWKCHNSPCFAYNKHMGWHNPVQVFPIRFQAVQMLFGHGTQCYTCIWSSRCHHGLQGPPESQSFTTVPVLQTIYTWDDIILCISFHIDSKMSRLYGICLYMVHMMYLVQHSWQHSVTMDCKELLSLKVSQQSLGLFCKQWAHGMTLHCAGLSN